MSCGPFCSAVAALDFFGLPRALGGTNPSRGHFTDRCNCEAVNRTCHWSSEASFYGRVFNEHNRLLGHWSACKQRSRRDSVPAYQLHSHVNSHADVCLLKSNHYDRGVTNTVYITILQVILSKTVRFHSHCLYTCQRLLNVSETSHLLPSTIFIFTRSDVVTTMWDNVKPCCWGRKFYVIFSLSIF